MQLDPDPAGLGGEGGVLWRGFASRWGEVREDSGFDAQCSVCKVKLFHLKEKINK